MKRHIAAIALLSLTLGACAQSPIEREAADHASCTRLVAERNDSRPTAYQECRDHLMAYRQQKAIASSGTTVTVQR